MRDIYLPVEVWWEIFRYLPYFTLVDSVKLVSKHLYALVVAYNPRLCGLTPEVWIKIFARTRLRNRHLRRIAASNSELRNLIAKTQSQTILRKLFRLPLKRENEELQRLIDLGETESVLKRKRIYINRVLEAITIDLSGVFYIRCKRTCSHLRHDPCSDKCLQTKIPLEEREYISVLDQNITSRPMPILYLKFRGLEHLRRIQPRDEAGDHRAVTVRDFVERVQEALKERFKDCDQDERKDILRHLFNERMYISSRGLNLLTIVKKFAVHGSLLLTPASASTS